MQKLRAWLLFLLLAVGGLLGTVAAATYSSACYDPQRGYGTTLSQTWTYDGTTKYFCGYPTAQCSFGGETFPCPGYIIVGATVGPASGASIAGHSGEQVASDWIDSLSKLSTLCSHNVGKSCDIYPADGFQSMGTCQADGSCVKCNQGILVSRYFNSADSVGSNKFSSAYCGASSTCNGKSNGATVNCGNYLDITCTGAGTQTCATSCSADSNCKVGYICKGSSCATNSAPSAPVASDVADAKTLSPTLTWTGSTDSENDAITYEISYGTSSPVDETPETTSTSASKQITLSAFGTYYWKVKACDSWACSAWSAEDSFTLSNTVPSVPTLTDTTDAHDSTPSFQWNDVIDGDGHTVHYNFRMDTIDGGNSVSSQEDLSSSEASVSGLTPNTYYWSSQACDDYECSAWATSETYVFTNTAPDAPTLTPEEDLSDTTLSLDWSTVADPESDTVTYNVRVGTTDGGSEFLSNTGLSSTTQALTNLAWDQTYYWSVQSCDPYACSPWASPSDDFTVINNAPAIPTLTPEQDISQTSTTLDWSQVSDPEGHSVTYDVRVGTTDGGNEFLSNTGLSGLTQDLTNLVWGTTYYWSARACDQYSKCSAWASSDNFTVINDAPNTPTLTPEDDTHDTSAILNWSPETDPEGHTVTYKVRVGTTVNGTETLTSSDISGTSEPLSGLTHDQTYYWNVQACDEYGACSLWSGEDSFTVTNEAPETPVLVGEDDAHSTIFTLDWSTAQDPESDSVTYDIRLGTTINGTEISNPTGLTQTTYDTPTLTFGQTYYWNVRACDEFGKCGLWSGEDDFTSINTAPNTPTLTDEDDTHDASATLDWSAEIDPEGDSVTYNVRVGTSVNGTEVADISAQSPNTYDTPALTFGTTYYWQVQACDEYGACSLWSGEDSFSRTNMAPPIPTLTTHGDTHDTTVTLDWSDAVDGDGDSVTYDVRLDTVDEGSGVFADSALSASQKQITDLTWDETYYWSARACDEFDECSAWAASDSFRIGNLVPTAPTLIDELDSHDTTVTLEWTNATDADNDEFTFSLRIGTVSGGDDFASITGITYDNLARDISGLAWDETYFWSVQACDLYGCSDWATEDSFTVGNYAPSQVTLNPVIDSHDEDVTLEWTNSTDADGDEFTFSVKVGTVSGASDVESLTGLSWTESNHITTGLIPREYFWSVQACDSYGCGQWATEDSFNMTNEAPLAPALTDETNTHNTAVTLEWAAETDPNGDSVSYDVRVGTTDGASDTDLQTGIGILSADVSGLTHDTTYFWSARTCDEYQNCSAWQTSDTFDITNTAPTVPALTGEADTHDTTVNLEWENVTDADNDAFTFSIRVGTTSEGNDISSATGLSWTELSYNTPELSYDTTYYWSVQSCDEFGKCSAWATEDTFTVVNNAPSVGAAAFNQTDFWYGDILNCTATASDIDNDAITANYQITGPNAENYQGAATCADGLCYTGLIQPLGAKGEWSCVISVSDFAKSTESSAGFATMQNTPPTIGRVQTDAENYEIDDTITLTAFYSDDVNPEDTLSMSYKAWDTARSEAVPNHYGDMICAGGQCTAQFTLYGNKGLWNISAYLSDGTDMNANSTIFTMDDTPATGDFPPIPAVIAQTNLEGLADDANVEDTITGYSWELSNDGTFTQVSTENPFMWDASTTLGICSEDSMCTVRFNASVSDGSIVSVERTTTIDTVAPILSDQTRTADPIRPTDDVELNITVAESHLEKILIETNQTGEWANYTPTEDNGVFTLDLLAGTLSEGQTVSWRVYANDSANNSASTAWDTFTVLDEQYPIISNLLPLNETELPFGTTEIMTSFDTHENASCRYDTSAGVAFESMTGVFDITENTTHNVTFSGLSDGNTYTFYVKCSDYWVTPNISPDYVIEYSVDDSDHTAPSEISHETSPAYINENEDVTISFEWVDNVDVESVTIWHNATGSWVEYPAVRDGDIYSVTIPSSELSNGQFVGYNSTAVDISENENTADSQTYGFIVANHAPDLITLVDEETSFSKSVRLEWNAANDIDGDTPTYNLRLGTTENGTEFGWWTGLSTLFQDVSRLTFGTEYHWSVQACDAVECGPWANEDTFDVVDNIAPIELSHYKDESDTVTEGTIINIHSEWSDENNLGSHNIEHNMSGHWYNESSNSFVTSWANYTIDTTGMGGKTIEWRIWADDAAGNLAGSSLGSVTVQSADLAVISIENNDTTPYAGETVKTNATIENQGDLTGATTARLLVEGTEIDSTSINVGVGSTGTVEFEWIPTALGNTNVTISVDSLAGENDLLDNSATEFIDVSSKVENLWPVLLSPDVVMPGSHFESNLYIYNIDTGEVSSIQIDMATPDGLTLNNATPTIVGTIAGEDLNHTVWNTTAPMTLGYYTMNANVSQTGLEGEVHDDENITVNNPHSPLLSVDVAAPPIYFTGHDYEVIGSVYNYGNETANNTWVNLTLPGELSLKGGEIANKMIGDLVNGTTDTVKWQITALQTGSFSVQVNTSSEDGSKDDGNSKIPTEKADLSVTSSAVSKIAKGTSFEVTASVTNNGDADAKGVWVNLTLPGELSSTDTDKTIDVEVGKTKDVSFIVDANTAAVSASYKVITSFSGPAVYHNEETRQINVKLDNKAPDFSQVSGPSSVYEDESATVSSAWSDEFMDSVLVWHNATGVWKNETLTSPYSFTIPASELQHDETVEWYFWANDTSSNNNETQYGTIKILQRLLPTVAPLEADVVERSITHPGILSHIKKPEEPEPKPPKEVAIAVAELDMNVVGRTVTAIVANSGNATLKAALTVYVDGDITNSRRIELGAGEENEYEFTLNVDGGKHEIIVAVAGKRKGKIVDVPLIPQSPSAEFVSANGASMLELNIPQGSTGKLQISLYQDNKEISQQTLDLSAGSQMVSLDGLVPGDYEANVKLLSENGSILYQNTISLEKPLDERTLADSIELNTTLAAIWLLIMALGVVRVLEV